jgi:hypothetical protein
MPGFQLDPVSRVMVSSSLGYLHDTSHYYLLKRSASPSGTFIHFHSIGLTLPSRSILAGVPAHIHDGDNHLRPAAGQRVAPVRATATMM